MVVMMKIHSQYSNLLQFEILQVFKSLFHFSTTCNGGCSKGNYTSFNLGEYSGDSLDNVNENRKILTSDLGIDPGNLFLPYQIHEDKILLVDDSFLSLSGDSKKKELYGIDAIITDKKNICIGITTADCVPVLIFDPAQQVLAAIHAGWRSTVALIVPKVVKQMVLTYKCEAKNLIAGIAPAISQNCFEVGEEVVDAFIEVGLPIDTIGHRNDLTGKMHIDLVRANELLLMRSGVLPENIEKSGMCTYSNPDMFFSARRQTIKSGRMVTGGVLR